jgi:hypothetical protein
MQFEARALESEGVTMSTKTETTRLTGVLLHLLLLPSPLPLIILIFSSFVSRGVGQIEGRQWRHVTCYFADVTALRGTATLKRIG